MKQRTATNQAQLDEIADKIRGLGEYLPLVITVTEGTKIRSTGQNARYWAEITYFMEQIQEAVSKVAEYTGFTELEVKRLLAADLPVEQAVILFARIPEAVHDQLKQICGIPTSTRLGTKAFMKFEDRMAATMTEILGNVNNLTMRALSK